MRLRRADDWKKYAFSFIGIVDFLAILPLWAFTGFDLRVLRAFRLFRLVVTTTKLATRTSAVAKLARAFHCAREEAGALFAGTCIIVVAAGSESSGPRAESWRMRSGKPALARSRRRPR